MSVSCKEKSIVMEFHEKLQQLRKQKGLTQEELAASLYVSRAAVSKWESGRGYPSIDSLKMIAGFYKVTIDELLSGDELLSIAESDGREKERHLCDLVTGLLDSSAILLLFLPLFGQWEGEQVRSVSLLMFSAATPLLRGAYLAAVLGMCVIPYIIPDIIKIVCALVLTRILKRFVK